MRLQRAHPRVGVGIQEPHLQIRVDALKSGARILEAGHMELAPHALSRREVAVHEVCVWHIPALHLDGRGEGRGVQVAVDGASAENEKRVSANKEENETSLFESRRLKFQASCGSHVER